MSASTNARPRFILRAAAFLQVFLLVATLLAPAAVLAEDPSPDPSSSPAPTEPAASPDPTPDPTPESTPDPTPDPTPEASPETTPDPTPAEPAGPATVTTDQEDYYPGATVYIGGFGWPAGATVTLTVYRDIPDDGIEGYDSTPYREWTTTASPDGSLFDSSLVMVDEDFGVFFRLVATSGDRTAEALFMDSIATDCFRSIQSGAWNDLATWESAPAAGSCTVWSAATVIPTNAATSITVQAGHNVDVTAAATAKALTVQAGAVLTIDSGITLNAGDGAAATTDLTVNGTVEVDGTLALQNLASTGGQAQILSGGLLSVNSGGLLNGSGGNVATRPSLTVNAGGSWTVDAGGSTNSAASGLQVTINAGATATFDGPVTVGTTGVATVFNGSVTSTSTLTINGTGTLQVGSTGVANFGGAVTVGGPGNIIVDGTVTSSANISAQTPGNVGNLQVNGSLTMTGGTLSTTRGNGGTVGSINNGGTLTLDGSSNWSIGTVGTANATVASGGTLDLGPNALVNGAGSLIVASGATLKIGSVDGIAQSNTVGNIRTTSATADSYSSGASYEYNGIAAQVTGAALPGTVNNLTIANTGGVVTPTNNLRTDGTLEVKAGATFEKIGAYTLTIGAGGVSNDGTIRLNGTTSLCPEGDNSLIRSSASPTQRNWAGSGTFDLVDVNVQDQVSTPAITAYSSTGSNNGANWTIDPNCAPATHDLTYTAGANGSLTGDTSQNVNHGADGTPVTAIPDPGYVFVSWTDGVLTASRTDTNVQADVTVTANFAINTYDLTYTAGTGGTIGGSASQNVNHGADGTPVTAIPDPGYVFVSWTDGVLTASRTDTNVQADITVTANFQLQGTGTYTIDFRPPLTDSSPGSIWVNEGKAGKVLPVKVVVWLDGTAQTNAHIAAGELKIKVSRMISGCNDADSTSEVTTYASAGSSNTDNNFRWSGSEWIYNLDTKAMGLQSGYCYRIDVLLEGVPLSDQDFAVYKPVK